MTLKKTMKEPAWRPGLNALKIGPTSGSSKLSGSKASRSKKTIKDLPQADLRLQKTLKKGAWRPGVNA